MVSNVFFSFVFIISLFILILETFFLGVYDIGFYFISLSLLFFGYISLINRNFLVVCLTIGFFAFVFIPYVTYEPSIHNPFPGYEREPFYSNLSLIYINLFILPFCFCSGFRDSNFNRFEDISESDFSQLSMMVTVSFFLALANYILYSVQSGNFLSLFNLFDYRSSRELAPVSGGALIGIGLKLFTPAAVGALFLIIKKRSSSFLWLIMISSFIFMISTGTRQNVFSFILCIIFIKLILSSYNFYNFPLFKVIISMFSLFALSNIMRILRGNSEDDVFSVFFLSLYYDTFDSMCFVIKYVHENGFAYFYSIFSLLVNYVPRFFWSDKPVNFGREVAFWAWGRDLETSASYGPLFPGEMYANGGLVFLILASASLFYIYNRISKNIFNSNKSLMIRIQSLLFLSSFVIVFRGEFVGAFIDALVKFIIPIFMVYIFHFILPRKR